jgi:gentisate 1,2-dioxygenase
LLFSCCDSVAALPALANCNGRRGAADNGPGTTIKYLRQTTSGAAGNGLGTTIKYLRRTTSGAAGNGLDNTIKYLRRTTSTATGNGLGTTIMYLVNRYAGAGKNWAKAHYTRAQHEFC